MKRTKVIFFTTILMVFSLPLLAIEKWGVNKNDLQGAFMPDADGDNVLWPLDCDETPLFGPAINPDAPDDDFIFEEGNPGDQKVGTSRYVCVELVGEFLHVGLLGV
jgi:hypothetical protein